MRTKSDSNINSQLLFGLGLLADDERYMKRALKSVKRLVAEKQKAEYSHAPGYLTTEEASAILDESVREVERGKYVTSDKVFAKMVEKYPFLCR